MSKDLFIHSFLEKKLSKIPSFKATVLKDFHCNNKISKLLYASFLTEREIRMTMMTMTTRISRSPIDRLTTVKLSHRTRWHR
jgi:hypothetical protein